MNDRSALRFDLAWRNRLNVCVAFHADFSKPAEDKDGEDKDKNAEEKRRAKIELMNRMGMGDSSDVREIVRKLLCASDQFRLRDDVSLHPR